MTDKTPEGDGEREFLVSHQVEVVVEELDGKKVVRYKVLPFMQGHTFTMELRPSGSENAPVGPYRFEYVLGSEFAIHENNLPASFEAGHSYLRVHPDFGKAEVRLKYADGQVPAAAKEASLAFVDAGGVLKRIVITTTEEKLPVAIRQVSQVVADLLDAISYIKRVPLAVRHIEVHSTSVKFLQRYLTVPYQPRPLTPADFRGAHGMPARLKPALRLFREAISSSRPPYRLLCLYRIREVLDEVSQKNIQEVLAQNKKPIRTKRTLPDNAVTREYFPDYVGKKVGMFLDHVRTTYRLPIAHANLTEFFKLVLDPADVRIDHRLDYTNAVLEPVVADMISDEIQFMADSGLSEPPPAFEEVHEG